MVDVYERAKSECAYDARLFKTMVLTMGGVAAAKKLLSAPRIQSGYENLWMLGRLDITMEARILKPKYEDLFEPGELKEARIRLESVGYDIKKCYG